LIMHSIESSGCDSPSTNLHPPTKGTDYGWFASGGPGAAAPLISAVFALSGNASKQDAARKFWITKGQNLNHVNAGEDGLCGGEYLCQAGTKQFGNYSGPAGWGTPNGVKAF
jgi:hypothetical protein